jgi:hypothetical protein
MFNLELYRISNVLTDKKPSTTSSTSTTRGTTSTTTTTRATTTSVPSSRRPTHSWPNIDRPLSPSRGPPLISLIPISSSTTPSPQPSYINTRRPSIVSTSFSTTTTTTTTRKPTAKSRATRPNLSVVRTQDNEINDSLLKSNNKAATARLNMGGIIALGVFGGFVFLAAVITIVVIIVRR